ncbi:20113_t:CDS:2 [Funneliformis geosporum]|uniref:14370_t:CDS:1 n=1 Tax=Funneliformis geosporum TaxID=1117311 RepID=A0A9W4SKY6_9GLOM|nr:20113_t:CDS:2 [Funneliformis geosporum]CAI2172900.1 14370_t:CDS:2 [Funneliformis geosporum]
MKNHKTSKQYLGDWSLFQSWLYDSKLNIQIKCLVNFAEHFYEPLMQFMIGQDIALHLAKNFEIFFTNELLEALDILFNEEFGAHFDDLERE